MRPQDKLLSLDYVHDHSVKKWKGSLEGSLDWVLFAVELDFPKILVPRLPKHTSDVNTEYAGKLEWPKQLYYLYGPASCSTDIS